MAETLQVWLGNREIGSLSNLGGNDNLFSFNDDYLDDDGRPVLSQAFILPSGSPVRTVPRLHRVAPEERSQQKRR